MAQRSADADIAEATSSGEAYANYWIGVYEMEKPRTVPRIKMVPTVSEA